MTRPGTPLTRARSPWYDVGSPMGSAEVTDPGEGVYRRNVRDGVLLAIVQHEPPGWHISVSFRDHRRQLTRYPSWDEIADARYRLVPEGVTMAMILPPPDEYVALHDTTFHLHEIPGEQ